MKKVLLALLVTVLGLSVSAYAITAGKIGIGIDTGAGNNTLGVGVSALFFRYNFSDSIVGRLGINSFNDKDQNGNELSQTGYSVRIDYILPISWGAAFPIMGVQYSHDGAAEDPIGVLAFLLGFEAEVADGVVLGAALVPYSAFTRPGKRGSSVNTGTGLLTNRTASLSVGVYLN